MRNLVVIIVVAVLLGGCTGGHDDRDPAPTPSAAKPPAPVPSGLPGTCPPTGTRLRFSDGAVLPDGAVEVRMCNTRGDYGEQVQVPADALTEGVDAMVAAVNLVPDRRLEGDFCAGEGGAALAFWFTYPAGDVRAVRYQRGACLRLMVGPGDRRPGGARVPATFSRLLAKQRNQARPPGAARTSRCDHRSHPSTGLDPVTVVFATLTACLTRANGHERTSVVLTREQVTRVNHGMTIQALPVRRDCDEDILALTGYTVWGDLVEMVGDCDGFELRGREDSVTLRQRGWVMPATIKQMLLRALEHQRK